MSRPYGNYPITVAKAKRIARRADQWSDAWLDAAWEALPQGSMDRMLIEHELLDRKESPDVA